MTVWQHSTSTNTSITVCRQADIIQVIISFTAVSKAENITELLWLSPYAFTKGKLSSRTSSCTYIIQNTHQFQKQSNSICKALPLARQLKRGCASHVSPYVKWFCKLETKAKDNKKICVCLFERNCGLLWHYIMHLFQK